MKNGKRLIDEAIVDLIRKPKLSKSTVTPKRKPVGRASRLHDTQAGKRAESR